MLRKYITTPIFYVNSVPHIGHAYSLIVADVIARSHGLTYLTGTDEHGQKILDTAIGQNVNVMYLCNNNSHAFSTLCNQLHIKEHFFIRTTSAKHIIIAKKIWNTLKQNNMIYDGQYSGWYAKSDECFYKESELINGKAPTGSTVEYISEACSFFKLSLLQENILNYIYNAHILPEYRKQEAINFVQRGLLDLAISRSTKWGIDIGNNQTMYVWVDALCSYLDPFFNDDVTDVPLSKEDIHYINNHILWKHVIHIIGKDILIFHVVYWPAILIACGLIPPQEIFAHGWFLSNNMKMSKSIGNIIDPMQVIEKYGYEILRFALLKEPRLGEDGLVDMEKFDICLNSDLINNIGNLFNRALTLMHKHQFIPSENLQILLNIPEIKLDLDCSVYIEQILALSTACNKLIQNYQPWYKQDNNDNLYWTLYKCLSYIAEKLECIMPDTANNMKYQLNSYITNMPYTLFKKVST